jgi:hypothetical protein
MRVKIRLADVPEFAWKEHHEDQVKVYSKLTEFAFEALKTPLIQEWLERFAEKLHIQNVEVRLNRMPHHEAKLLPVEWRRREVFKPIGTFGRSSKKRAFIEIYPLPHFINKTSKPHIRPSLRGEIPASPPCTFIFHTIAGNSLTIKNFARSRHSGNSHRTNLTHNITSPLLIDKELALPTFLPFSPSSKSSTTWLKG